MVWCGVVSRGGYDDVLAVVQLLAGGVMVDEVVGEQLYVDVSVNASRALCGEQASNEGGGGIYEKK